MLESNIEFHSAARQEFVDAFEYYDERNPEVANRFADSVEHCFQRIARSPQQFPKRIDPFRHGLVEGFPYVIIIAITESSPYVVAFAHTSRNPDYWKDRVDH